MTHFRDVCGMRRLYEVIDHTFQVLIKQYCVGNNICGKANQIHWLQKVFPGGVPAAVADKASGVC